MDQAWQHIRREQLRRQRPERDLSITGRLGRIRQVVERTSKRLADLVDLWDAIMPQAIVSNSRITGIRGGVVHVIVDSPSTSYELDRLMREGALAELRRRSTRTIARVRVTVGQLEDPAI